MPFTAVPEVFPQRTMEEEPFNASVADVMAWWPTFLTDFQAMCTQASTDAANALAAASGAANTKWISGTTYAIGDRRWSPITYGDYRRKTAGAGTTDPSLDTTNWASTFSMSSPIFSGLITGGSLTLNDAAARIKSDFSNSTLANRCMFQSSTVNGAGNVEVIPSGTSNVASFNANNNSDPDNGSRLQMFTSDAIMSISSTKRGTASYLPLSILTSDVERIGISIAGVTTISGDLVCGAGLILKSFTKATRPVHSTGKQVYVTDAPPNFKVQTSDGTNWLPQGVNYSSPVTKIANFTLADSENVIINNKASTCVATLPNPADHTGRVWTARNIVAQALNSNASNVIPLNGGAAGTAILAATIGKWADLLSNGTAWEIIRSN